MIPPFPGSEGAAVTSLLKKSCKIWPLSNSHYSRPLALKCSVLISTFKVRGAIYFKSAPLQHLSSVVLICSCQKGIGLKSAASMFGACSLIHFLNLPPHTDVLAPYWRHLLSHFPAGIRSQDGICHLNVLLPAFKPYLVVSLRRTASTGEREGWMSPSYPENGLIQRPRE